MAIFCAEVSDFSELYNYYFEYMNTKTN